MSKSSIDAAQAQSANLLAQLEATHRVTRSLEARLAVLEHKRKQFVLLAPLSGTILGEELPRMSGKYLLKGTEICRIADARELMVRIQVPERQIGDVRVGESVRVKPRALPDRIFRGVVSRIGSESELDENRQAIYRVELSVTNDEGLLRPGMTAFARIDFGRHLTGWILAHKIKQALRPEMWML